MNKSLLAKHRNGLKRIIILENDEKKSEDYPKVKSLIDDYHKICIRESLKNVHLDWNPLMQAIGEYQKSKNDDSKAILEK